MGAFARRVRRLGRRGRRAFQFDHHAYWRAQPIRLGTVLYESFSGNGMLCNPEAIFRELMRQPDFASLQHIWALSDFRQYRETVREFAGVPNVTFVKYRSAAYFRALATSEFLINNATFPAEFSKRTGQIYLNTWHGTPLKRMGYDMPGGALEAANTLRNFVSADYLLAANSFMATQMYESAYKLNNVFEGLIIEEGYPRIDRQLLDQDQFMAVRGRLERAALPLHGRDIVLYAPTWKGDSFNRPEDDIESLVSAVRTLQTALGERYIVLLKTHQVVHQYTRENPELRRFLVPNDVPTNEVLGVSTALITDYSSIFFDFLPTGRPIVFYTPDMTDYSDSRGVYFPASEWPGPVCTDIADVALRLHELLSADQPEPSERYTQWQQRFTPHEDGGASARVIDIVFRHRRRGYRVRHSEHDERPRVLFYLGGMRSNGITASALNLLSTIDHARLDVSVLYAHSRKTQQRENQEKIHPAVRQFPRVGGMNGSKLAQVKRRLNERRVQTSAYEAPQAEHDLYNEEWSRCFGNSSFDDVIDFSGYSPFWARLMLHSPEATRSIWLHNDMAAEVHREVGGKQSMRRSLPAVFALYNKFDHLVSVSARLSELNSRQLAAYAPADRFTSVRNLIDANRVLQGADADLRELDGHPIDPETEAVIVPPWVEQIRGHRDADGHKKTTWFVTAGRLSPEKNQARLIGAFAAVYAERPDVRLLIVGNGPLRAELQRDIDARGLSEAAILTGAYQNPFAIMAAADCFVLSSNYEGQPMVLLEAAILALPIVSVEFSSVHDALPNDDMLIVGQSEAELADGLRAYLHGDVPAGFLDIEAYTRSVLHELDRVITGVHPPAQTANLADGDA
ncbi:glycosyltransferase [Rathayibacter soli]|uniref:glycosyltransferase n=1 Tax=Rathayibacter soli TaxID=3144168 RepID=UPI0027E54832|nr:glycosyltransferase [Glaciibacter superstes]